VCNLPFSDRTVVRLLDDRIAKNICASHCLFHCSSISTRGLQNIKDRFHRRGNVATHLAVVEVHLELLKVEPVASVALVQVVVEISRSETERVELPATQTQNKT